jgi:UDP-glucuronate 4-epimerase
MAFNKFVDCILSGRPVVITQALDSVRSVTYIDDCVAGIKLAIYRDGDGSTFNIAGAQAVSLREVLAAIAEATGRHPIVVAGEARAGDQPASVADIGRARIELGFQPEVSLSEGIIRQVSWQKRRVPS